MKIKGYFTLAHLISLSCVALGILFLIYSHSTEDFWAVLNTLSYMSLLVGGLIVSLMMKPSIYKSSGILGLTIGFSVTFGMSVRVTSTDMVEFIIGCTVLVCGVLNLIFALSLFYGKKYNVIRMKVIFLIYMGVMIVPLILSVALSNVDIFKAMSDMRISVLSFVIIIGYFILLNDPEIKYTSTNVKISNNIGTISNIILNDPNAYINRDDFLSVADVEDWTPVNEGPIVSENILPLTVSGKPAMLITHLWDDGRYFGEIVRSNRGTVIQSLRFEYAAIVFDNDDPKTCHDITIYGKDGFFIRLLVSDDETKFKKVSKGVRIIYRIMGY